MNSLGQNSSRQFAVHEVLPHAGRMLLLDRLMDYGPEHVTCGLTIRPDTLFSEPTLGVPAWVGIEYMAQTAGVYSGINDRLASRAPAVCLLLGARSYRATAPYFSIGSSLRIVTTLVLRDDDDLAAFQCAIYSRAGGEETIVATGDIKAYRPRDLSAVVRGERPI
jgi:predicted hotdog family 3-hydroxylacyl-ACP dehydratase